MPPGLRADRSAASPRTGRPVATWDDGGVHPARSQDQVQYTCPMHPEITRDSPGDCPKCGMHLTPATGSDPGTHAIDAEHGHPTTGTQYTCPMHPEITRDSPGDCPKCGMHLTPATGSDPGTHAIDAEHGHPTTGTQYTCPMHPEILRDHPGRCPKCGMHLEPMFPTADDDRRSRVPADGPPVLDLGAPVRARPGPGDARRLPVGRARPGHTRCRVVRGALLRLVRGLDPQPLPQHVDPDRAGGRDGVCLLGGGDPRPRFVPRGPARPRRIGPCLLRGRGGHLHAHAAGPGPGTARPNFYRRCDQGPARARPGDRSSDRPRR